ncbi:MAG: hypothetical protein COA47_00235 [Robiginitomaculum sp.]|nr:MAG: hypothetical protein COA47_00235 [Robiginitomaculum sp.]
MSDLEPAPLVELDDDPTPVGTKAFWFEGHGGIRLRAAICPAQGKAKGSILFSPGRSEYVEKYFEFAREMTAKGYTLAVIDHRGQGLSDRLLKNPLLGHVVDFSDYARDMECLWPLIADQMPAPRILMAHSMGGAVAMDVLRRGHLKFDKMIGCAPMLGFAGASPVMTNAIRLLSTLGLKKLSPPGLSGGGALDPEAAKILTSDPKRFDRDIRRNKQEPKLQLAGPTIGWLHAALKLFKSLQGKTGYRQIDLPISLTRAGHEALVSNSATEQACKQLPNSICQTDKDALHEIFQERDELRDTFMARIDGFLKL